MAHSSESRTVSSLTGTRSAKTPLGEIAIMSLLTTLLLSIVVAWVSVSKIKEWSEVVAEAGVQVTDHIGWAFGIYIPLLLGLYAIVIGGQLLASPAEEAKLRRKLGLVSEVLVSFLVPAVLTIVVVAVSGEERGWSLIVVLPALGIAIFLASQLGSFVVFEIQLRLEAAKRQLERTKYQLSVYRVRGKYSLRLMVPVYLVGGVLLAVGMALLNLGRVHNESEFWVLVLVIVIPYALFIFVSLGVRMVYLSASGVVDRIAAGFFFAMTVVMGIAVILTFLNSQAFGLASFMGTLLVLVALSVLWPRRWRGSPPEVSGDLWPSIKTSVLRHTWNWSLHASVTRSLARKAATDYARQSRLVKDLSRRIQDDSVSDTSDLSLATAGVFKNRNRS